MGFFSLFSRLGIILYFKGGKSGMKKKIALLLTVIMALALLPTNVFASSVTTVSHRVSTAYGKTVTVERYAQTPTLQTELSIPRATADGKATTKAWADEAEWIQNASSFVVELKNKVTTGDQFRVQLKATGGDVRWALGFYGSGDYSARNITNSHETETSTEVSNVPGALVNIIDPANGWYYGKDSVARHLGLGSTGSSILG